MKDKIKLLLEKYINYVTEMNEVIDSVGKKQILIDLISDAEREQLWDLQFWLSNAGFHSKDEKNLRDFAINVVENYYKDSNLTSYNEKTNHEIENAIFNALHKDKEEYLNEEGVEVINNENSKIEYPKNPKDVIKYEYPVDDGYMIDLKDDWVDPVGNNYIHEKTKREAYRILKQVSRFKKDTLKEAVELHGTLNPSLWDGENLKTDVAEALLNIANTFINNLGFPIDVADIRIVGSNASYNYNEYSDIDLHIISNFDINYIDNAILQQLYNNEKNSFNNKHDIAIKGIPVELYVEDMHSMNATNGSYSLLRNEWIKFPEPITYEIPDYSKDLEIELNKAEQALLSNNRQLIKDEINHIYLMRKDGLAREGEASIGNLVFKEMRNMGVQQRLADKYYELESKDLSLESENLKEYYDTASLIEWGEETSEDIEYRKLVKIIRDGYGDNFKIPVKAGLPALRKIATGAQKVIDRRKSLDKVNINKKDVAGYEHFNNDNFKFYFKDGSTSILNYNQAKPYLDVQDYNDKDREEYELDHLDEHLIERAYYNDVTTDELNDNEVKLIVVYKDDRSEKSFNNIKELFKYVKECGGFNAFKGCYWCIRSDYKEGEFYLERDRFSKGGWRWYDVNGDSVQGQEYRTPRSTKQENTQLNEVNLVDIINDSKATDPKRIKLAQTLYTEYKGIDSDGTILFETDSQTRSNLGHQQKIFYEGFFNLLDKVDENESISEMDVVDILTGDVNIYCSCESFLYGAWAYKSWKDGYGLMKELRAPTRNNTELKGGACKHILSVLELINRSDTIFNKITEDLNILFNHYKKANLTKKEIERLQNELKAMQAPNLQTSANNETISKTE